jgi:hypothetical protein
LAFDARRVHVAAWTSIGFVGFFVKLIFIPINKIIVGSGSFDSSRCFFCF